MSKAILGGTLTSEAKNGSYATAYVHDESRKLIRDHDAKQVAATLTAQFVNVIMSVNGLTTRARWVFDVQEPADFKMLADSLPKLVEAGAQIPVSYVNDKLKYRCLPMRASAAIY